MNGLAADLYDRFCMRPEMHSGCGPRRIANGGSTTAALLGKTPEGEQSFACLTETPELRTAIHVTRLLFGLRRKNRARYRSWPSRTKTLVRWVEKK